jgi:hypothetical protein
MHNRIRPERPPADPRARPRRGARKGGARHTCVLAVVFGARLGEDLEVDEAEGHQPQGEARHEAREEHQHHDDGDVLEELRLAAVVLHRHPPPHLPTAAPLLPLSPLPPPRRRR